MANTAQRFGLIALAIAKMVFLVIAVGTVGYYVDKSTDQSLSKAGRGLIDMGYYGRQEFFLFATAVAFFVAVFSIIIAITGLHERSTWAAAIFMAHSFCALSLLISASLLARLWAKYSENSIQLCELLERNSSDARCYQLIIGVVCGFVSMVLFITENIIYVVMYAQTTGISFVNMDNIAS